MRLSKVKIPELLVVELMDRYPDDSLAVIFLKYPRFLCRMTMFRQVVEDVHCRVQRSSQCHENIMQGLCSWATES